MDEIWKQVIGFEGLYEVSNIGRVRSLPRSVYQYTGQRTTKERILKQSPDGKGYMMVWFYKDDKRYTFKVHRLVAQAFIPNPLNKPEIDHINADKKDNNISNLRWCTSKENFHNPITYKRNSESKTGSKNHKARKVVQISLEGDVLKIWDCIADVRKELGFNHSHISQCCSGIRNIAYGFLWKYKDE